MDEVEIEIPSYFVCPISMQLMKDPVTVATGITYDRESIEKWVFSCRNTTCPVTKQQLVTTDLTPNHTLRRLIQAWCTLNASHGVERIPTPKPAVDKAQILKLIDEARRRPESQLKCLRRIRSVAFSGEYNKKEIQSTPGAVDFLVTVIKRKEVATGEDSEFTKASDEALTILHHLGPSDSDLKRFIGDEGQFLDSLIHALKHGNYQSRAAAIMVMKSAVDVADPAQLIAATPEIFAETVQILKDNVSQQATKAALKLLMELCPWGRNRIKAAGAGAVQTLVDLLLDTTERRLCELALTVLDQLCDCAEGRAELLDHGAGLAIVSKKILRVSHAASDRAVRVLSSISKFSATSRVLQEMLQVGVVAKLCLVLQVDASSKTKERAKQTLRLHSRVWRDNSSCIPRALLSSYPS
ncbi:PREDICTED: E3 ubiquitin-protein ligase PUB23-like isoform X3 [Ipomoea nil]|nr:PREDICTED: E3 ubiquitin-protein ligase PUB23-like isoform X2 [Ipomoea nil]XP_019199039.1 PREDICTED: E3 ubiquitin-protein ligase PUB23-like isoform X3 [Ipomoea nil]XP_019199040.1 PREDICTED: E3 ubiquitin-protein ligase PUB23-like isoform X3 [Ipomoea nil]XP_019199041.1 PREDICTED: E3 ubiquitin-protein ligase PUB23-like isoform X3 [Ipomoea nil]